MSVENMVTFTSAIKLMGKVKLWREALEIFKQMTHGEATAP